MKFLLSVFVLCYTLMAADALDAANRLGAEHDYYEALKKAKSENKMVVMIIVKENCRWCDKIINQTLSDDVVKKRLERDYVTVIVDRDDPFPNDFKENFFPSIFYIDSFTGKSVYENVGYVGTKCFMNDLNGAQQTRDELYSKE